MSIKTNYKLKEVVEVEDSIMRIDRLWGSSKEGWTALVGVYITLEKELEDTEDVKTTTIYNKIDEFNHSAAYVVDERGYETLYKSLQDKYGGEEC